MIKIELCFEVIQNLLTSLFGLGSLEAAIAMVATAQKAIN